MGTTSDDLLTDIRRTGFLPDAMDLSDTDILALADAEVQTIVSMTLALGREDQWLSVYDQSLVPGTRSYPLPRRALGRAVRAVMVVLPDGSSYPVTPASPVAIRSSYYPARSGLPEYYAFEGDRVALSSTPADSGYLLRVLYLFQPSRLILASAASPVVSPASTTTITLPGGAIPSTISAAGSYVDIVSGREPHDVVVHDLTTVSYSDPTLTVSSYDTSLVSQSQINREADYVCPAGQTVYPPVASVMWPSLVRGTVRGVLDAIGDPRAERAQYLAEEARRQAQAIMEPRDSSRSKVIRGSSPLRASRRRSI